MSETKTYLRDLNDAISRGTAESRLRALWHTTDLMITGGYSDDEIWTFGEVIGRLADEIEVCIVPALCPLEVSPYDFSAARYLMQRAEESTRKWLDGGGLLRRPRPQELEAHHH